MLFDVRSKEYDVAAREALSITPLGFSQIPVLFLTRCKGTTIPGMAVPLCPSLTEYFYFSVRNQ